MGIGAVLGFFAKHVSPTGPHLSFAGPCTGVAALADPSKKSIIDQPLHQFTNHLINYCDSGHCIGCHFEGTPLFVLLKGSRQQSRNVLWGPDPGPSSIDTATDLSSVRS